MTTKPPFENFTEQELDQLYQRYIGGEKIADLIEEFNLTDIRPSSFISKFPHKVYSEPPCPYCNEARTAKRISKSSYHKRQPLKCPTCNHQALVTQGGIIEDSNCRCSGCWGSLRDKIKEIHSIDDYEPVLYDTLSFAEKLFLLTLLHNLKSNDNLTIFPVANLHFYPRSSSIIKEYAGHLIIPDPISSSEDSFDSSKLSTYYTLDVNYLPNISLSSEGNRASIYELFQKLSVDLMERHNYTAKDIAPILETIFKEELWEYFEMKCDALKLKRYQTGPKFNEIFTVLLEDFSISESIYFLKASIERASNNLIESNSKDRRHAFNCIPSLFFSLVNKAKNEKWSNPYRRDSRTPKSCIGFMLDDILPFEGVDSYFTIPYRTLVENISQALDVDKIDDDPF